MTADGLTVTISTEAGNKNGAELLGSTEASGHTNDAIETQEEIVSGKVLYFSVKFSLLTFDFNIRTSLKIFTSMYQMNHCKIRMYVAR
jgi:hypothetical protein